MIQLGMPTLIETESIEESVDLCQQLGLQFIELNMNMPMYQSDNLDVDKLSRIMSDTGIYFTIHLDENLNVCDFNKNVSDAYTYTVLNSIEIAKRLCIPVLNMHLSNGVYFTMPDKKVYLYEKYYSEYIKSLTSFRDACTRALRDTDIKIWVENTDGFGKVFLRNSLDILLESSVFGLTFDIGHNAAIGGMDEEIILSYGDKLMHFHVHDAKGTLNHLPLGTGNLNLNKYLNIAKERSCRVVLETKTIEGLKQSVEWTKNKGMRC